MFKTPLLAQYSNHYFIPWPTCTLYMEKYSSVLLPFGFSKRSSHQESAQLKDMTLYLRWHNFVLSFCWQLCVLYRGVRLTVLCIIPSGHLHPHFFIHYHWRNWRNDVVDDILGQFTWVGNTQITEAIFLQRVEKSLFIACLEML